MKRFLRRWKYTLSAVLIIAASITALFFPATRTVGELILALLILNSVIVALEKL